MSYIVYNGKESLSIKTKISHPYSYDPIVQFRASSDVQANSTVYSDRLYQWDYEKHNTLLRKHFGNESQYWDNRNPLKIQDFMRDWNEDQDLQLITIIEYCNVSTGYPCWRFDYYSKSMAE
jgi:hypothetical protein